MARKLKYGVRVRDMVAVVVLVALTTITLSACGRSEQGGSSGAGCAESAVTTYVCAVVRGDGSLAREVVEPGSVVGDVASILGEYFGLSETVDGPLSVTIDSVMAAGEDPNDKGYAVTVRSLNDFEVLTNVTVYVGLSNSRYYVWGVSD